MKVKKYREHGESFKSSMFAAAQMYFTLKKESFKMFNKGDRVFWFNAQGKRLYGVVLQCNGVACLVNPDDDRPAMAIRSDLLSRA